MIGVGSVESLGCPSTRAGTTKSRPKLANDTGPEALNSPGCPGPTTTSCTEPEGEPEGEREGEGEYPDSEPADTVMRSERAPDTTRSAASRRSSSSGAAEPISSATNAGGPGTTAVVMSTASQSFSNRPQRLL